MVNAARRGTPQTVTRHGRPAVVVLSSEDYERLKRLDAEREQDFTEHLLAMPQTPDDANPIPETLNIQPHDPAF